ncbi:protein-L-isoaspartate O-methyltransferase, partial [Acinetobacter baumannii]
AVNDPRVVAAMARVPREDFLPVPLRTLAYRDRPLPLGDGRYANLPEATGRLLTEAKIQPGDDALLIGAGGGYTAALL